MQRPSKPPLSPRPFIWSCLAALLGTLGLPAVAVWPPAIADRTDMAPKPHAFTSPPAPEPAAAPPDQSAPSVPPRATRRALRCAECGVVGAVREIRARDQGADLGHLAVAAPGAGSAEGGRTYEITVRMSDGTPHVFIDPTPGNWRPGDRLIRIEGAGPGAL